MDPIRSKFGNIEKEEVDMDAKTLYIRAYIREHSRFSFRQLLEKQHSKTEIIVTFLVMLEEIKLGDWLFRFHEPYYPGLRAKIMPIPVSNSLLEIAMLLLLAGLFLSFYLQPVLVKADAEGYTVAGPRPEKMRLELEKLLAEPEEGDKA